MISIKQVLTENIPSNPVLKATVLQCGECTKYTNKEGQEKSVFQAIIADSTDSIRVKVYTPAALPKFTINGGVTLMNFISKPKEIVITMKSIVAICAPVPVPNAVRQTALKLEGSDVKTVEEVLHSPQKDLSSIKVKVIKVTPTKQKQWDGKTCSLQEVVVRDHTSKAKLALWGNLTDVRKDEKLKITRIRSKNFKDEKKLSTTPGSEKEILAADSDLDNMPDTSESDEMDEGMHIPAHSTGQVIAMVSVECYAACPIVGCNIKKLQRVPDSSKLFCQSCSKHYQYTSSVVGVLAKLLIEKDADVSQLTFFTPSLKALFNAQGCELRLVMDSAAIQSQILQLIPCQLRYTQRDGVATVINSKRPLVDE